MRFTETKLAGAFIVDLDRREDYPRLLCGAFCQGELADLA